MRVSVTEACRRLRQGEVVAVPTETVYGLAACLDQPEAIKKIFSVKKRPSDNPLIVHLPGPEALHPFLSTLPPGALDLANEFWPGPLTLVMPVIETLVPPIARAGLPTAGFRVPGHPLTLDLLTQIGPVVAPSANLSGSPSSTTPEHVEADFGPDFPVVDGGPCDQGLESTILVFEDSVWAIARLGALPANAFQPLLGYLPKELASSNTLRCPGRKYKHYAPKTRLLLDPQPSPSQVVLGYDDRSYHSAKIVISLGSSNDPSQVAHHLYDALRHLDSLHVDQAWVDLNVPNEGLWVTIRERLQRASHG